MLIVEPTCLVNPGCKRFCEGAEVHHKFTVTKNSHSILRLKLPLSIANFLRNNKLWFFSVERDDINDGYFITPTYYEKNNGARNRTIVYSKRTRVHFRSKNIEEPEKVFFICHNGVFKFYASLDGRIPDLDYTHETMTFYYLRFESSKFPAAKGCHRLNVRMKDYKMEYYYRWRNWIYVKYTRNGDGFTTHSVKLDNLDPEYLHYCPVFVINSRRGVKWLLIKILKPLQ